jgi:hypothetical protein
MILDKFQNYSLNGYIYIIIIIDMSKEMSILNQRNLFYLTWVNKNIRALDVIHNLCPGALSKFQTLKI